MVARKRRRYAAEERAAAIADVARLGVCGAARAHGMPQSCVSRWASEKKKQPAKRKRAKAEVSPAAAAAMEVVAGEAARAAARRYTPSQKAAAIEHAAAHGVSAASEKLGISRFSIYGWRRQVAQAAQGGGPSPTSGPAPAEIEAQWDREILNEWHKHPGLGPSQIVNQLRRAGVKVSVHTARQVMIDAGYRPPKVKREPHDERFEAVRPNHLWHLDFVHRHINRSSTFTLILIDDCSRYVTGHGVDDAERADFVIEI